MTLILNWKDVLKSAWSVKMGSFSALFGGLQQAMGFIPSGLVGSTPETWAILTTTFGVLSLICAALVPVARIIDQKLNPALVPAT